MTLDGVSHGVVVEIGNHTVGGLAISTRLKRLYWADTTMGRIGYVVLGESSFSTRVMVTGLIQPRAIITYNG